METGFEIVFANDIKNDAKAVWKSYFEKKYKNIDDIYKIESIVDLVKKHKEKKKVFPENIDIVIGGFPRQDFSIAGNREGLNSSKNHKGIKITKEESNIKNRGKLYIYG